MKKKIFIIGAGGLAKQQLIAPSQYAQRQGRETTRQNYLTGQFLLGVEKITILAI